MESHRRGDLTEQIVITELKRRGIAVSSPVGDNERYDLVLEQSDGQLFRVQVKTGRLRDGVVRFKAKSQHTNASGHVYRQYGSDEIDWFLVYCYETEELYLIDADEVGTSMHLRVSDPVQETSQVNWAEDYLFDTRWPLDARDPEPRDNQALSALRSSEGRVFLDPTAEPARTAFHTDRSGTLRRVRIESGWVVAGRIRFDASAKADCYLVFCEELDEVFAVSDGDFDRSISLRVDPPQRDSPKTNLAEAFRFENNWPPD